MSSVSLGTGKSSQSDKSATMIGELGKNLLGSQQPLSAMTHQTLYNLLFKSGADPSTKLDPAGAIEQSRMAEAKTLRETADNNARAGLAGTPFGEGILANQRMQSNYNVSQIAPAYENQTKQNQLSLLQSVLQIAPQYLANTQQAVMSGLGAAVGGNVKQRTSEAGGAAGLPLNK
jgi:hypothetical protein